MKRTLSIILAFVLMLSFLAFAEADSWTCSQCGTTDITSAFCENCGNKKPENIQKLEGDGCATPQEAAIAYLEAIKAGDIPAAVSTFAIESAVDHANPEHYMERIGFVTPVDSEMLPAAGPLTRGILISRRCANVTDKMFDMYLYYSINNTAYREMLDNFRVSLKTDAEIEAYENHMRAASMESIIGSLEIIDAYLPEDPALANFIPSGYLETAPKLCELAINDFGGEAVQEVFVLLSIAGMPFAQCMRCVRYDGKWYNLTASGSALGGYLNIDPMCNGLAMVNNII